jgi:glycosyltransferase involved in cell wall biosynthesis
MTTAPAEPRVSVVIPTYNRAARVRRAIDSVLAQTVPDVEVIVVDDGSSDETPQVLAAFGSRIRVLRQANRGVSAARNAGIALARGRWVALLDSDDEWLPEKLERQLGWVESAPPGSIGVCFTDCAIVGDSAPDGTLFGEAAFRCAAGGAVVDDAAAAVISRRHVIHTSSLLIERGLLEPGPAFDPALKVAEDTDLLFRLALRTRFAAIGTPLVRLLATRTAGTPRLSDAYVEQRDAGFADRVRVFSGWQPLVAGQAPLRARVLELRRQTLVDWIMVKWRSGQPSAAWRVFRSACRTDGSTLAVMAGVLSRIGGAVARRLAGRDTPADVFPR